MPGRQHEAVSTQPGGIAGIVSDVVAKEQVGRWREGHGGARVTVSGPLDRVHGQRP